jgi:hypothetical protein
MTNCSGDRDAGAPPGSADRPLRKADAQLADGHRTRAFLLAIPSQRPVRAARANRRRTETTATIASVETAAAATEASGSRTRAIRYCAAV